MRRTKDKTTMMRDEDGRNTDRQVDDLEYGPNIGGTKLRGLEGQ